MRQEKWGSAGALWLLAALLPAAAHGSEAGLRAAMSRVVAAATDADSVERATALWPVALDAPLVLHDPASGVSLHWSPRDGRTRAITLPAAQPVANSCFRLDGVPTAMVLAPLSEIDSEVAALVWHERWHCVQATLGLSSSERDNAHLDTESGRTWLRLELRALRDAVASDDDEQARAHARAALAFRAARGTLGDDALAQESALERNEGLAEYTGRAVAEDEAAMRVRLAADLRRADAAESYVRTFAYATGPAYGMLLERWAQGWRERLADGSALSAMLGATLAGNASPTATSAENMARSYGIDEIRRQERERTEARETRAGRILASLRHALRAPLRRPQVSFDPRTLFPLGGDGMFYATITIKDMWGELRAYEGALLASDWSAVSVGAGGAEGCGKTWSATGWKLQLAPGWRVVERASGLAVEPGEPPACAATSEAAPRGR